MIFFKKNMSHSSHRSPIAVDQVYLQEQLRRHDELSGQSNTIVIPFGEAIVPMEKVIMRWQTRRMYVWFVGVPIAIVFLVLAILVNPYILIAFFIWMMMLFSAEFYMRSSEKYERYDVLEQVRLTYQQPQDHHQHQHSSHS